MSGREVCSAPESHGFEYVLGQQQDSEDNHYERSCYPHYRRSDRHRSCHGVCLCQRRRNGRCVRPPRGKALEAELRSLGAEAAFILADVRHEDDVRNLVEQTVARFGRLDVAVNNAGTEGKPGPLAEQTSESYAGMFDTNVLGTLLSLKHELRVMQPQGSGSIINISSTMGERGAANLA